MATNCLANGVVLTLSAQPLDLPSQALKLLLRLRQLAGKSRRLVTYTQSLATLFEVTTNTIRAWRRVLVDQGYIHWSTSSRTGMTTVMVTELVEPPSRRAAIEEQRRIDALPEPLPWQPAKPVILRPDPRPWWKYPAESAFCLGGAKSFAPTKTSKKPEAQEIEALARKWGLSP